MSYGYFSDKYNLPTQVKGDTMSEREEKRKSRIIDNQLYISLWLHGTGNGVIKEGMYLGTFSSGNSSVRLIENKPSPALECLISQVYGYTTDQLNWTGLANNTTYYLYATIVENATDTNPSGDSTREYKDIGTSFNNTGITPSNSILIATAATTASAITITTNPSGKRYIKSIEDTTEFVSGLTLYGNADFRQAIEIDGGIISGLNIYGSVVITGTGSTFAVWEPTTFNRPVTFNDYIIGNPLVVRSGEDIYGNETVRGNLEVQGKLASGIDVFGGNSVIRDDIVLQRTLDVLHDSFLQTLTVRSGENIYGDSIFHDNVTIQNNLKTEGHTSASGLTIFGNLYITGSGAGGVTSHSLLTDMPSSINTDHDGRYYKAGDNPNLSGLSIFGDLHVTGGFPVGPDEKIKVTANDTTPNYLTGKLLAGTNVTLTENNDGGNETLTIAATDTTNAPGGNDREVQFNNATAFGGAAGLRYDSTGLVIVNSGLDVSTTFTIRSSVNVQDSLSVEDSSTLKDVTVTAQGSLTVNGPTTVTALTARSGLDITTNSTFRNSVNVQDSLSVEDSSTLKDVTVTAQGSLTINGPTSTAGVTVRSGIEVYNNSTFRRSVGIGDVAPAWPYLLGITGNKPWMYIYDLNGPDCGIEIDAGSALPSYIWSNFNQPELRLWANDDDRVVIQGPNTTIRNLLVLQSGIDVYSTSTFRNNLETQKNVTANGRIRSTNSDIAVESNTRGIILKDTQGTPHYWRITVNTSGVLVTADLGTSLPAE